MLQLEDKIIVALAGPIKAGKDFLAAQAPLYQETLLKSLQGNFWVPPELTLITGEQDPDLFERYSFSPESYAEEFQYHCMARRLAQQNQVDAANGLVLLGQPLEIDRWIYAEANRKHFEGSFHTYEMLHQQIQKRVTSPDLWIYLRIPEDKMDVLLQRIRERGRPGEKQFLDDPSYLLNNIRLNDHFFSEVVHQPVITIDATDPVFGMPSADVSIRVEALVPYFQQISREIRKSHPAPRLTLDEWGAVDHNRAQNAFGEARRQLRDYLAQHQTILTFAGNVGAGKTGMAELVQRELEAKLHRELSGKGNQLGGEDSLLSKFLRDKKRYARALQEELLPIRLEARARLYALGESFTEDRSPVEDQCTFWRRLHQQGHLSDEDLRELKALAIEAYSKAPKSDVFTYLQRSPRECRRNILMRGRPEEVGAWPEEELQALDRFYQELFTDMEQYDSHHGPKIILPSEEFDPKNTTHQGWLWQEILQGLLERDDLKADRKE